MGGFVVGSIIGVGGVMAWFGMQGGKKEQVQYTPPPAPVKVAKLSEPIKPSEDPKPQVKKPTLNLVTKSKTPQVQVEKSEEVAKEPSWKEKKKAGKKLDPIEIEEYYRHLF